eukprot:TRINITY_DN3982_c0_g1_i17.p1 TRINITY_DN3982_c0_g1~~TRINITY_DN3982_c0_g1_i17.p1  ORF type:complete len:213 (-),score=71.79 TRINITY_DN3982_c0_g1_i17:132-770(-)
MEINSLRGKDVMGTINWPTLNNAKTNIRGKIEGNRFSFEEYEAISSADDVQIPSYYVGTISHQGKVIKGKTVQEAGSGDEDDATFQLDLVEDEESEELSIPKLKEGLKLQGKCVTEHLFSFKIMKRKGDSLTGQISWKDHGCKTNFKGTVTPQGIKFDEYELLSKKGDDHRNHVVTVPMMYLGNLSDDGEVVKGESGPTPNNLRNKFEILLT